MLIGLHWPEKFLEEIIDLGESNDLIVTGRYRVCPWHILSKNFPFKSKKLYQHINHDGFGEHASTMDPSRWKKSYGSSQSNSHQVIMRNYQKVVNGSQDKFSKILYTYDLIILKNRGLTSSFFFNKETYSEE